MKKHSIIAGIVVGIITIVSASATTYTVSTLADSGSGSLRSAITAANAGAGNTITFTTNGTITLAKPLPYIIKPMVIDATTAPGYTNATSPVVSVNFSGGAGLTVATGGGGSMIKGFSLVNAGTAALTLLAPNVAVSANYIGLNTNGTVNANYGDGIAVYANSSNNLIGSLNPASSISYTNATNSVQFPLQVFAWQGLRANGTNAGSYLISGTGTTNNGIIYVGPISGAGNSYSLVGPTNWTQVSPYGPDSLSNNALRVVGSCKITNSANFNSGFVWEGTTNDLGTSLTTLSGGTFRLISYPGAYAQYTHSSMGDLAVGNYITNFAVPNSGEGAYICKLINPSLTNASAFVEIPTKNNPLGAKSITAYGIWDNGVLLNTNGQVISHPYTICGGYSPSAVNNITNENVPLTQGQGYLVDYDAVSGKFSNWTSIADPHGKNFITHFEGIGSSAPGVYVLAADSVQAAATNIAVGSWVSVNRNNDGTFSQGTWVDLLYPGISNNLTSANSVCDNQVVGLVLAQGTNFAFQVTVNIGFNRANVISGNRGNGISLIGSKGNVISQNYIGTDPTGTAAIGNQQNGIQCTVGAGYNVIGGQFVDSNNPTGSEGTTTRVYEQPPLGNLISGNYNNGILIGAGCVSNAISGNWIGIATNGTNALGNGYNGIDIESANGNAITGCGFYQKPFVYYNVVSGNGKNGIVVNNSTNIIFQGNYVGISALDSNRVPNAKDGLLITGSSKYVQVGGVIPLGSVISGNGVNGTEISGTASYCTNFNTFGGMPSFQIFTCPNGNDGILITSTGGKNTVRTCVMSGNSNNGVEIGGNATGVLIEDTTAGTETDIMSAAPNQGCGIVISGSAHGNQIGGFDPSIELTVHASGNMGYGIAVLDHAYNNSIQNCFVGLAVNPQLSIPNTNGGIYLGPGTFGTTLGGKLQVLANYIVGNTNGDGVTITNSTGNSLFGNLISSNAVGIFATGNCAGTVINKLGVTNNSVNWQTNTATGIIYQ
jgi:trimeric autotransporter adhesin